MTWTFVGKQDVITKELHELKAGDTLASNYGVITWAFTDRGLTDITVLGTDDIALTTFDRTKDQKVNVLDIEPHPLFNALQLICIEAVETLVEQVDYLDLRSATFAIDEGSITINDEIKCELHLREWGIACRVVDPEGE